MSQFKTIPVRRSGGDMDVFTVLLVVAFVVLTAGVVLLGMKNTEHSGVGSQQGSMFKLIDKR